MTQLAIHYVTPEDCLKRWVPFHLCLTAADGQKAAQGFDLGESFTELLVGGEESGIALQELLLAFA